MQLHNRTTKSQYSRQLEIDIWIPTFGFEILRWTAHHATSSLERILNSYMKLEGSFSFGKDPTLDVCL